MVLYKLNITPPESASEAEDWSEWFGSLTQAKHRRAQLLRKFRAEMAEWTAWAKDPNHDIYVPVEWPCRYIYGIDRVTIAHRPRKRLALAILNRRYIEKQVEVVPAWNPPGPPRMSVNREP